MNVECECGSVTFKTPTPAPMALYHCHCDSCRKQSSTAYGTSAIFPAEGIFPLSDDLRGKLGCWTRPTKEGRTMDCYFCRECGIRVMHRIREANGTERATVSVKGGLVDGLNWKDAKHIYAGSAVVEIPKGAERWETTPPLMDGRPQVEEKEGVRVP